MEIISPLPSSVEAPRLPPASGIGLKPQHYSEVLGKDGDIAASPEQRSPMPAWVEVHPQNYFAAGGASLRWLDKVAQNYPLSFHSTGLSLGSAEGPSMDELERLANLADRFAPASISDHLSWSITGTENFPDLLPLPYTADALDHMVRSIDQVQERLGRAILVENPSRYLAFAGDEMSEAEFLHLLCSKAGCGLLFDINNVVVSAGNLGLDATAMVDAINPALVGEIHLAGHAIEDHGSFTLAIDDHGSPVDDQTWTLFERFIARAGTKPTLIEWDTDVPEYAVLMDEAMKAQAILSQQEVNHVCAA